MSNLVRPALPANYAAQLAMLPAECRIATDPNITGIDQQFFLNTDHLLPAVTALDADGWYLEDITGLHVAEGFLLRYHFSRWDGPWRVCLRLTTPNTTGLAGHPAAPSIASAIAGAEWHEREVTDFYGIIFAGNPNPTPLLLTEEQAKLAPLRKDTTALKSAFDLLPDFEILTGPDSHPLRQLLADRLGAAKIAKAKATMTKLHPESD